MTRLEETKELLENVIRGTYFDSGRLEHKQRQLELLRTPEGKESIENFAKNSRSAVNRRAYTNMLNNYDQNIVNLEDEIRQMEAKKTEYEEFMSQNRNVIDYIAILASGSRKKVETPSEKIVFETLRMLSGKIIMGELGAGAETLEITLALNGIVETAAYKHAQRIGEEPKEYCSRIIAGQTDKVIAL